MCGIAGYSLTARSDLPRTLAAQALLAGIAERGADAVGYAHRFAGSAVTVRKERGGASVLLERIAIPHEATQVLLHVRDYTKGHPRIEANNHPVRHGALVGVHNGIIVNDDELFAVAGIPREQAEMTVDSEIIFALAERARGRTGDVLERLYGSMAAAWLDEERHELVLARGMGRPLWTGQGSDGLFFASTRTALELVERYTGVRLKMREVPTGALLAVDGGRVLIEERFRPDLSFAEEPLPTVRAPGEQSACLSLLAALAAT
jgi:glucosamine 6-phosphate synthetase-like amidotransferase/phosphosugar isomerase protein